MVLSHLLIAFDYILKDFVFANIEKKMLALKEGLRFGNLGRRS